MPDNPINNERWAANKTPAEYWRVDNPYIAGWYRFGDDEYPISETLGQPARCDSSIRHNHLTANQALGTFLQYVSGIAPWPGQQASASGVQITGANWNEAAGTQRTLRVDSDYYRDRTDFSTLGYYGQGNAMLSGFTIMGWMQIPPVTTQFAQPKKIWSNIEQGVSSTDGEWQLNFNGDSRHLVFIYNSFGTATSPAGATHIVTSLAHPNGRMPVNEPVFFACQINKGYNDIRPALDEGSGIMRIWMGTHVSGLQEVGAYQITIPSTNFWRGDNTMTNNTSFPYTFFADPVAARGNLDPRCMPPSSIFDEFCIVNDGTIGKDLIEHYMNSGIIQDDTDPLGNKTPFVPVLPGTDDLVAYWTFDEQGGANLAPDAPTEVVLDMVLNGVDFVDGVHGGSGIRPNSVFNDFDTQSFPTNKNGLPHVIGGSGLNHLFPERDQTWIGWVRSESSSIRAGGALGWFSDTADRHCSLYWQAYIFANQTARDAAYDLGCTPSGSEFPRQISIAGISTAGNPHQARTMEDGDWHLLAVVWDVTHGFVRVVYDAHDVMPMLIPANMADSGIDKSFCVDSGPDRAGFVLTNINSTNRCSYDDWAVYDRILTLPEMSGFALSGIDVTPIVSPISTNEKRTLGYWLLDEAVTYDPEVASGVRYNDDSWYRHHLSNVSGHFEQGDALNVRLGDTTASITHSGSIMSVPGINSAANLDFSSSGVWASSGMTVGCWMYLPSGDLETQGNGSSGLFGDHMFMGVWDQEEDSQSWMLGMRDNKFLLGYHFPGFSSAFIESESGVPFNTPFFVAAKIVPSGSSTVGEIFVSEDPDDALDLQLVGRDAGLVDAPNLVAGGLSGFTLFGAANLQFGFPSGTRMQAPFVYAGSLIETDIGLVKRAGVNDITLGSGSVPFNDPASISHWRFDRHGAQVPDAGRAGNYLTLINTDGNQIGIFEAVHSSGVVVRQDEYLTTQTDSNTSGLDLATDDKSWTFLTWIKPNTEDFIGEGPIMGKGGPASGVEVFMTDSTFRPASRVSGVVSQAFNGDLAPGEWNHLAIVFDKDNDEFETIVNGRYAGGQFNELLQAPPNNSGLAIGGRGDQLFNALFGGPQFSGMLDDTMLFSRALTLPEVSGLAANSYNFIESSGANTALVGGWLFGTPQFLISGLIGSFLHGQAQDLELVAGYLSGVEGVSDQLGGFLHGKAQVSGTVGAFMHGAGQQSGVFGHFVHGLDIVSGFIGSYTFGACEESAEFDIILNFNVVTFKDFDARLAVEKTKVYDFDARLGVIRITDPPECTIEAPPIGTIVSGLPFELTVSGSGIAQDNKKVSMVRFTFADFKGAESGVFVQGVPNSGLYKATRTFDTPGWYNLKIEVLDSYGYRTSCCRPFLLLPDGVGSGDFLNSLPGISIETGTDVGSAIEQVSFVHSLSGLNTTSGLLEYTDFADQQESLVNSLEMPTGTQFVDFVRRHDYTMPGRYCPVWAVSGSFGIVSDTIADGIDYLV